MSEYRARAAVDRVFFVAMVICLFWGSLAFGGNAVGNECVSEKALMGDSVSAKRCAEFFLKGDQKLMRYWAVIAAENGDVVSQYNYAIILLESGGPYNKIRAMFWLKKASDRGFIPAKQTIEELKLHPNGVFPAPPPQKAGEASKRKNGVRFT